MPHKTKRKKLAIKNKRSTRVDNSSELHVPTTTFELPESTSRAKQPELAHTITLSQQDLDTKQHTVRDLKKTAFIISILLTLEFLVFFATL